MNIKFSSIICISLLDLSHPVTVLWIAFPNGIPLIVIRSFPWARALLNYNTKCFQLFRSIFLEKCSFIRIQYLLQYKFVFHWSKMADSQWWQSIWRRMKIKINCHDKVKHVKSLYFNHILFGANWIVKCAILVTIADDTMVVVWLRWYEVGIG